MPQECPTRPDLAAFAVGDLADDALDWLASHVEQCLDCQERLARLDEAPDELVGQLMGLTGAVDAPASPPETLLTVARQAFGGGPTTTLGSSQLIVDAGRRIARALGTGPVRLGKFELIEELGVGSFGYVFRARDTELDRMVAIKVQRAGGAADPASPDRFRREARSAAQLKHPSIVALYETGETDDGAPYLVTEYVRGETLEKCLLHERYDLRRTARLVAEIAAALHYAHAAGILHRDIKPSNILIDESGSPHIIDFGLTKRDTGEATMTPLGDVMGTPAYMSPEQARGDTHNIDARTDIYSLGVILYELLTGQRPFQGNRRMLTLQVLEDDPRPPRRLDDRIPRDLETICVKAMARSAARRYSSSQEFADDLHRFLRGEPILARPIGRFERLWRWSRRNPLAVGLLIALTLGSVFGLRHLSRLSVDLVHMSAYDSAAGLARVLEEVNAQYSDKIVQRLGHHGIEATFDYARREAAIPLPATFLTELADSLSAGKDGMQIRHYSDYPFLKAGRTGPPDAFARDALASLREKPGEPYVRFVDDFGGRPVMRFASARIMQESCVACHNTHPQSIKRDWKVGEVRGVLEIIRPLDRDRQRIDENLRSTFLLVGAILVALLGLTVAVILIGNLRRHGRFSEQSAGAP